MERMLNAMRAKDVDGMLACMRPDVELRSPITRRIAFKGQDQVGEVLRVVYATIGPLAGAEAIGEGRRRVLLASTTVGGRPLEEAVLVELDEEGRIAKMTLFIRTMPDLVTFAAVLGPLLARRRSRLRALVLKAMFGPLAALVRVGEPVGVTLTGAGTPVAPADRRLELG